MKSGRTIEDLLKTLDYSEPDLVKHLHEWPPDLFAATSTILQTSGAYTLLVSPPTRKTWPLEKNAKLWRDEVSRHAKSWRRWQGSKVADGRSTTKSSKSVDYIKKEIDETFNAIIKMEIEQLACPKSWLLLCRLFTLHAISDQACEDVGIQSLRTKQGAFKQKCLDLIEKTGSLSRFSPQAVRVLPKMRTPQSGISIRSLSHHICCVRGEVDVKWTAEKIKKPSKENFQIMLFPWPFKPEQIRVETRKSPLRNLNKDRFGFFAFCPKCNSHDLYRDFDKCLESARESGTGVSDMIVLPECATTPEEFDELWRRCISKGAKILLAGIRDDKRKSNEARLIIATDKEPKSITQCKHHRWCLDKSQISNYDFGASLNPQKRWWEAISLSRRSLNFVCLSDWLTLSHLICEDLARSDPTSEVLRAVGPTLLIALLLDGPQLKDRWAARYASVLVDDPGTSILTLTSLGMAERSRNARNRTIGYWREAEKDGVELKLQDGAVAAVLTLWGHQQEEFTADGRTDSGAAGRLAYGGFAQLSID